ncbi:MAG: O-antigen ligase family protein, partial [Rhabdochlamydiaceae bacterium]
QLSIAIFFIWALLVTAGGIILNGNPPDVALREILNLLPLLILPLLYERYIKTDSKEETTIFWFVLIAGFIIILGDFWIIHNNIVKAVYLYEMGRAVLDMAAICLIILAMVSFLMSEHPWYLTVCAIIFLLLGIGGLLISFTRSMYIWTFLVALLMLAMGSRRERRIGLKNLSIATIVGIVILAPVYLTWKLLRLLMFSYLGRLLTTEHFTSDLSLRMRFSEWRGEWHAITQSPILGHGFGASFRSFDIVHYYHVWLSFSHNSYLYIIFKTGFIGGILFLIPTAIILYKGLRLVRSPHLSSRARMVLRAVVASTIVILFGAFTGPTFDSKTAIAWLALGWGYILSADRANRHNIHEIEV